MKFEAGPRFPNRGSTSPVAPVGFRVMLPAGGGAMVTHVTAVQRQRMIAEAAYFLAQHRGFTDGDALQDWLVAEAEIDRVLAAQAGRRLPISPQEFEELMARAREAQAELLAEAHRIRMQTHLSEADSPRRALPEEMQAAMEALRAALESVTSDRK
jgi:hypothetical protein